MAFGGLFLGVLTLCLLAPVYARYVGHMGPSTNDITGTVRIDGRVEHVVSTLGIPIGPTWHTHFLLGATQNGQTVAVQLLYGGRTSLEVSFVAATITIVLGVAFGLVAGYYRGAVDRVLTRFMELVWAFPAVLLGVAIGTSIEVGGGIGLGPVQLRANSILVPALIIGLLYVPYVAKPIRGQVLSLREQEFVLAARCLGCSSFRIAVSEILPNLVSTILVLVPLMIALAILLTSGLSFLGAGVQPPNESWGTIIQNGIPLLTVSPQLVLGPGIALFLAVFGINVFGDGVRSALDPHAEIRIAR